MRHSMTAASLSLISISYLALRSTRNPFIVL